MWKTLILLCLFVTPASAQAQNSGLTWDSEQIAFLIAFVVLFFLAGYLAWQAFERGEIVLEGTPTLPKYMTRRPAYYLGALGFSIASMLIYCIIVAFYKPFLPIIQFISTPLYEFSKSLAEDDTLTYPLILVLAGVLFVVLLRLESRFNPLLILRNVFYRGAAIPKKVRVLLYCAKNSMVTPENDRQAALEDDLVRFVDLVDFDKDWNTIDRKWADTSHLFHWLRTQNRSGRHATFFEDLSLKWNSKGDEKGVKDRYLDLADSIGEIKKGESVLPTLKLIIDPLERVHADMCRVAACFLVYKNSNEMAIWNEAEDLGIHHGKVFVKNVLSGFVFYALAFVVSAYLGSALSFATYQILFGSPGTDPLSLLDPSIVNNWAIYSLLINGVPVFAVLLWRYFMFHFDPPQPGVYPQSYAWLSVTGFVIGAVTLSIAIKLMEEGQQASLLEVLSSNFQWAILPAVYCAFIAWRMDMVRHLPDPAGTPASTRALHAAWERLEWGIPCAAVSALVILVPCLLIKAESLPPDYATIGLGMLRWMIVGTASIIGLGVGLVARPLHEAVTPAPTAGLHRDATGHQGHVWG